MSDRDVPTRLPRRAFILGAAASTGIHFTGCRQRPTDARTLRLGYFPNLTHAPALTADVSGRLAAALAGVRVVPQLFNAGPAAIEALLSGAIDATFVGPIPAVTGHLRSHGRALTLVAGAASGGTCFVVRGASGIRGPGDLHGRRLAAPQVGNTQDVALRHYLASHGLTSTERGGDVTVTAMDNANILSLFRQGSLDGAWVPEPWASRLVAEAGGTLLLDERDLWPNHAFAITVLVARQRYLRDAPAVIDRLVDAHAREVRWLRLHAAEARTLIASGLEQKTGRPLPAPWIASAWPRIDFTADAQRASIETMAARAESLGYLPGHDLAGLFDEARITRAKSIAEAP